MKNPALLCCAVSGDFAHMLLRRHRKIVDRVSYDYWSLCEPVRTAAGPRQRVVATLGKLSAEETRPEAGWEDLCALLEGRPAARHMRLGEKSAPDLAALRVEWVRDFGEAWLKGMDANTCLSLLQNPEFIWICDGWLT